MIFVQSWLAPPYSSRDRTRPGPVNHAEPLNPSRPFDNLSPSSSTISSLLTDKNITGTKPLGPLRASFGPHPRLDDQSLPQPIGYLRLALGYSKDSPAQPANLRCIAKLQ